jgi:hypothetical protein
MTKEDSRVDHTSSSNNAIGAPLGLRAGVAQ